MSKVDKYTTLMAVDNLPTPHVFSVPIQETPMWKIKAIAE
jgi:hypothetical protein